MTFLLSTLKRFCSLNSTRFCFLPITLKINGPSPEIPKSNGRAPQYVENASKSMLKQPKCVTAMLKLRTSFDKIDAANTRSHCFKLDISCILNIILLLWSSSNLQRYLYMYMPLYVFIRTTSSCCFTLLSASGESRFLAGIFRKSVYGS